MTALPRHVRVATVALPEPDARLEDADADLIEWRLDAMWSDVPNEDDATAAFARAAENPQPVMATLRPERQGGAFVGDEQVRLGLLVAAAKAGFAAIDIENEGSHTPGLVKVAHEAGADVVLSDHRFAEAPSREEGLRRSLSMQDQGARLHKLSFPAGSFMDILRSLELAHSHAHRGGAPAIAPIVGADIRALLPLAGNHATYGHASHASPAVAGQPSLNAIQAIWDHWGISQDDLPGDPEAGWLAVLGDPVDHSLSPRIHNAALRAAGSKMRYGALRVPASPGAVRLLATVASRIGLRGASVTAPLKELVAGLEGADRWVEATGAANCFRLTPAGLETTNTDAQGLYTLLDGTSGPVKVIGAGGAARAAMLAAKKHGLDVTFTTRDPERAAAVAAHMGVDAVPWQERHQDPAATWIQAATIPPGECPVDSLPGVEHAIELVYGTEPTRFEGLAADAGARAVGGRALLLEQALHAFRFWTGSEPDRAAMEAALSHQVAA